MLITIMNIIKTLDFDTTKPSFLTGLLWMKL